MLMLSCSFNTIKIWNENANILTSDDDPAGSFSLSATTSTKKQFYAVYPNDASYFSFWAEDASISKAALYDANGKNVDLKNTDNKWSLDSITGVFYFLYVEYMSGEDGTIVCSI